MKDLPEHLKICELEALRFKVKCGHCGAINFYTDSGFEDCSKIDIEGIICYACGKESIFDSTVKHRLFMDEDLNDVSFNTCEGKPSWLIETNPPKHKSETSRGD